MTIPASDIVSGNPGVVGTGGNPLVLAGVMVSQNSLIPNNTLLSFGSASTVGAYFGTNSTEYAQSLIYFNAFNNKTTTSGLMWVAPYFSADTAAFLRSGSRASMTLTQLQALSGVLTITINGTPVTSSTINLSSATSFTNAATIIQSAFSGTVPVVTWNALTSTFIFTSPTTGSASTMTYATGTLSAGLALTQSLGAVLSQGAVADTPSSAMNRVIGISTNWATFWTLFEPSISDKTNFAVWVNAQNKRYQYVCWDTDGQAIVANSTTCFGYIAKTAAYDGVFLISGDSNDCISEGTTLASAALGAASFKCGCTAATDFNRRNGRITVAFKAQSGLPYTVSNKTSSDALIGNGYNFYGAYATANQNFTWMYPGQVPGQYLNDSPYINQIWLNNALQLADMSLLGQINSIPYNSAGYGLIRAAMLDPLTQGVFNGVIRIGVSLSNQQKAAIAAAAGADVSNDLYSQGYYLQILDPGAQVRGVGGSPIINLWYTDGGDIRKISFASVVVL